MLPSLSEKISSIHEKSRNIQSNLESCCVGGDDEPGCCGVPTHSWQGQLRHQVFYAHLLKLVTLFAIAVAHLAYMQPFISSYSALENYGMQLIAKYPTQLRTPHDMDTRVLQRQLDLLADYKKNVWMTVAAMCVSLSTSCFFLFWLPVSHVSRFTVNVMRVVDLVSFGTITGMLLSRALVAEDVRPHLRPALETAHLIVPADRLMNTLVCSIHFRERLPYCADLIVDSIFPVILLKYLLILAVLTLAYIGLAYLIEWCIRHWFPPSTKAARCLAPNKVYMPVILPPKNPLILDA